LDRLPGVRVKNVSYAKAQAEVLYDPQKATVAQMAGALAKFKYKAYPLKASN
jgi:copper chaperone CopZ|tara:strand:- start:1597 stop:1752 length:156 start_codon:yes stop_codon:yes gene_type:complete